MDQPTGKAEFAYNIAELKRLTLALRMEALWYRDAAAASRVAIEQSWKLLRAGYDGDGDPAPK